MKILKDNLPNYFEQLRLTVSEPLNLQELISHLKQRIPTDYLKITIEEGNYMCSTRPNWKDKPLCERYGFTYQGEWIQIDIPHDLMRKSKLTRGADITHSLYLAPEVLTRKPSYGGITLENEKEIILVNPHKIIVKEKATQTNLSNKEIARLEQDKNSLQAQVQTLKEQEEELWRQIGLLEEQVNGERAAKDQQITTLQTNLTNLNTQIGQLTNQVDNLTIERNNRPNITQVQHNNLQTQLTTANNLIINSQVKLNINNLNDLVQLAPGETLVALLQRPTQVQLQANQNQICQLNNQNANLNQQLVTVNNLNAQYIININNLKSQLDLEKEKLKKEQSWWDKWINSTDFQWNINELNQRLPQIKGKFYEAKYKIISLKESKSYSSYDSANLRLDNGSSSAYEKYSHVSWSGNKIDKIAIGMHSLMIGQLFPEFSPSSWSHDYSLTAPFVYRPETQNYDQRCSNDYKIIRQSIKIAFEHLREKNNW